MKLEKKVALITGASRGIGKAIAIRLAEEGAAVAVNYFQSSNPAREICDTIVAAGGKAICVQADVAQPSQVKDMVQTVVTELGPVDILVNNAGIGRPSSILETTMADLDYMVGVNLKGTILCVQAVSGSMMDRKYGRILNITSLAAMGTTFRGTSAYAATKAGLIILTKRMAMELGPYGITVNAIAPGFIRTDGVRQGLDRGILSEAEFRVREEDFCKRAMLGRAGDPEDVAHAALFLVSDDASFITAQTLTVDGGRMDLLSYSA